AETGNNLAQEFESLTRKIGRLQGKAGDVAARPCQARDHPAANWVQRHRKDDRDFGCHLLCREDRASRRDNDIDLKPHKLGPDLGVTLVPPFTPAKVDSDMA